MIKKDEGGQALVEYAVIISAIVLGLYVFFDPQNPGSLINAVAQFFTRLASVICLPGP